MPIFVYIQVACIRSSQISMSIVMPLPGKPFLYGHRALQDMDLSGFIFMVLFPFILYDWCRSLFCDCSLRNILVYRDPGAITSVAEVALDVEDFGDSFIRGSFRSPVQCCCAFKICRDLLAELGFCRTLVLPVHRLDEFWMLGGLEMGLKQSIHFNTSFRRIQCFIWL